MGADKAAQLWGDVRAVDWVFQLALKSDAKAVVTVGDQPYGFAFVPNRAPGSGPVGGILAAVAVLKAASCDSALVLAVDAPTIVPADLQPLCLRRGGAAYEGLPLPMHLPFGSIPADAAPDWSLARFVEACDLMVVRPHLTARLRLGGAKTPEDHAALWADKQQHSLS